MELRVWFTCGVSSEASREVYKWRYASADCRWVWNCSWWSTWINSRQKRPVLTESFFFVAKNVAFTKVSADLAEVLTPIADAVLTVSEGLKNKLERNLGRLRSTYTWLKSFMQHGVEKHTELFMDWCWDHGARHPTSKVVEKAILINVLLEYERQRWTWDFTILVQNSGKS